MRRCTFVLLALLVPLQVGPRGQQQPTFRVTANYIEVDATVTDARGAFVRDLTTDDFEVIDEGKPQNVTVMSLVDLPFERPDRPLYRASAVEPDVMSNATADSGRIYVIVLDAYHVGPTRTTDTRTQARQFVERYFGANDLAAVIHVGAPLYGQEFTSSRRRLLASIDRFIGQKGPSAAAAMNADAMARQNIASTGFTPGTPVDNEDPVRAYLARESLRTVRQVSEQLAAITGRRKAMLLFSEGIDYDTMEGPVEVVNRRAVVRDAGEVRTAQREMIAAATRANLSIYTYDPRGLVTGVEDALQIGGLPAGTPLPLAQMSTDMHRAQDTLRMFAGETGGRASLDRNEPSVAFERMMRDSSTYYMLGYNSTAPKDGRFHNVTVKVKRPGLEVRARQGYYASAAATKKAAAPPPDPIATLLTAAMPSGGLGLRVNAGVVRIEDPRAGQTSRPAVVHLTVEVAGKDISFEPRGQLFANEIEVAWQAYDERGQRKVNDRKVIGLKLLEANRDLVASLGVRHVVEMPLAPGRYQLRLAARERVSGRTGSVFYEIEVPDAAKQPLTLSDLLLTSASANGVLTTGEAPAVGLQLPSPVTTARTFTRTDTVAAAATVIVDDPSRAYTIDLTTTLSADDGTVVFKKEDSRSSTEVGRNGYLSVTAIPLERIAAGDYVVTVEARSRLGQSVVRETAITVK